MNTSQNTATTLPTGTWTLDPKRTTVSVAVKKLGFINVVGTLALTAGSVNIDANGQVNGVSAVAKADSYDSGNPKRDTHVHSEDFLNSDQHDEIRFTANDVKSSGTGYTATGKLSLKGKTTPITLTVDKVTVTGSSASFTASTTVNRRDIGLDKMPAFVIGNDLTLTVDAHATIQ